MTRFFTERINGDMAIIAGDDHRHLSRVLRMRTGDALFICDGKGFDYDGVIERIDKDETRVSVTNRRVSPGEPRVRLTVIQGLPKAGKLETVIQKCTEAGVCRIIPALFARSVARSDKAEFHKKLERYRRVAYEAAKQSQRGMPPEITELMLTSELDLSGFDLVLLCYEEESTVTLKARLEKARDAVNIAVIIGPEGGIADDEAALLQAMGALPVTLGTRILRTETAALFTAAQLFYQYE